MLAKWPDRSLLRIHPENGKADMLLMISRQSIFKN
jgi:hypothetical protein